MSVYVNKNVFLTIAGVDLAAYVKGVTFDTGAETQDITAMSATSGATPTRIFASGLNTWSFAVDFFQDFAASKVDATIAAALTAGTAAIVFRPLAGAESATNPTYTMTGIIESYNPVAGNVGDAAVIKVSFKAGGAIVKTP
jgi:hypothetical protein